MAPHKEPRIWLTALKLAGGACALIGLVWLALGYAESIQSSQPAATSPKPTADWGIANDSPIRNKR
jgi:hypothetical protein